MNLSHRKKQRVLLVVQDIYRINELKEHLNIPPVECEYVVDIETARNVLNCRSMDALVIDSALKNLETGEMRELLESIKETFESTKIVIFNGISDRTIQRQIRRCGADGYLSSKNNMKNVAGSVKRVLGL